MASKKGLVFGFGINDSNYEAGCEPKGKTRICPFYARWKEMLRRCYSEKYILKRPTYIGCTVCDEWLTFSNFKAWMKTQDWKGKALDKDIIFAGNKVYSADSCVFVDTALNNFMTDRRLFRGKWPLGVDFCIKRGLFRSHCSNVFTGKKELLGYFSCPEKAHAAWKKRKHELSCQLAKLQSDKRVAEALMVRYA
jgi:hypothetical protein